jgi:hypothetical protein
MAPGFSLAILRLLTTAALAQLTTTRLLLLVKRATYVLTNILITKTAITKMLYLLERIDRGHHGL